jgi:SAM-dependent methyltransferase
MLGEMVCQDRELTVCSAAVVWSDTAVENNQAIRLNLGCGDNIVYGYINHDVTRHRPEVDVVHDLQVFPWPWADDSAEEILLLDVLEHLPEVVPVIDECWRVLRPGGMLHISVPHYQAEHVWLDPTHRHAFHLDTFDYFDPHTHWGATYPFYTQRKWKLKHKELYGGNVVVVMCTIKGDQVQEQNRQQQSPHSIWAHQLRQVTGEITALIPVAETFILVDENQFGRWISPGREVVPFLEREGQYWGPPADGSTAIRELERLRQRGASFIVFGWPAFWWLDNYVELRCHLRTEFRCVLENDRLIVFDLRS